MTDSDRMVRVLLLAAGRLSGRMRIPSVRVRAGPASIVAVLHEPL